MENKILLVAENKTCVIDGIKDLEYSFEQFEGYCYLDITFTKIKSQLSNFIINVQKKFEVCIINPVNDFFYFKIDGNNMTRCLAKKNKTTKIDGDWFFNPDVILEYNYKKLQLISNIELK